VLELGCAAGGNLLPMADALPGSTFVGIDLSPHQIADADAAVAALGLRNAAFLALDIRDVTPALGEFDYIIAHGVYSWVAPEVREALLSVCSANLAPQGVAYVSYNTYPGMHMLQALREMMLYHARHETDSHQRAARARELVRFLAEAVTDERNRAYGTFIESYQELLEKQVHEGRPQTDSVILHDELAEWNDPVYFYAFATHAANHGLQFLIEADVPMSMPQNLSPEVFEALQGFCENIVETEQYMDLIRNRAFRRTLLCHAAVPLDRTLRPAHLQQLAVATAARRLPEAESAGIARFASADGATFQTDDAVTIAALDYLASIEPQAVAFPRLVDVVSEHMAPRPLSEGDVRRLAANLLKAFSYSLSLVELHAWVAPFVRSVSERPVVSAYARYQARMGDRVANLRHERVHLDALSRLLLPLLDGTRTRDDLASTLEDLATRGALRLPDWEGQGDPAQRRVRLCSELDSTLEWLARAALLVG